MGASVRALMGLLQLLLNRPRLAPRLIHRRSSQLQAMLPLGKWLFARRSSCSDEFAARFCPPNIGRSEGARAPRVRRARSRAPAGQVCTCEAPLARRGKQLRQPPQHSGGLGSEPNPQTLSPPMILSQPGGVRGAPRLAATAKPAASERYHLVPCMVVSKRRDGAP